MNIKPAPKEESPAQKSAIETLLNTHTQALRYTAALTEDLTESEAQWRPSKNSSAIAWHLGHQAAVTHFMARNLTAAVPSLDPEMDRLMDSATPEAERGALPSKARIYEYRDKISEHFRKGMQRIETGEVSDATQLRSIAEILLIAVINHEFQHSKWIGEVRSNQHGKILPPLPESPQLKTVDGYLMVNT